LAAFSDRIYAVSVVVEVATTFITASIDRYDVIRGQEWPQL